MADRAQSYANHIRWFPPFHFFVGPLFLINFLMSAYNAWQAPSGTSLFGALIALGLALGMVLARVQDDSPD